MAQPSELPEWATGGSAEKTEPTDQQKAAGWVQEDVQPHEWVNYWMNLVYQWIAHFAVAGARWDTLDAFIAGTVEGDTGIVAEYDGDVSMGVAFDTVTPTDGATYVAVSGQYLMVLTGTGAGIVPTSIRIYSRDLGTLVRTIALGVATAARSICTNGDFVAVALDNTVKCYAVSDGALRWSYDHTQAVHGVCTDGAFVYLCGGRAVGINVRKLLATNGALQWSYQHSGSSAVIFAICTDGQRVYFAGDASSYGSGATMRAIDQSSGADAAGEGGLGTAGVGYAWDDAGTAFASGDGCIATDGRILLCGNPTADAWAVEVRGVTRGEVLFQMAAALSSMDQAVQCCIDNDLLVVVGSDGATGGSIEMFDKRTFSRVVSTEPVNPYVGCASDCASLYLVGEGEVRRVSRGTTRPRVWRRVDPTDRYLPYRLMAIPEE